MRRIFIPEPNTRYNYLQDMESWGEVKYLRSGRWSPFDPDVGVNMRKAFELGYFDASEDLLCMTGNVLVVSMALAVACSLYPTVRILMFDARTSNYSERCFSVTETVRDHG